MEYYSATMKNEIMSCEGKWIEVDVIMLSKISQIQKDKYQIFSYMQNLDKKKGHGHKIGLFIFRGGESRRRMKGKRKGGGENIIEVHCIHL
jgi:hypothetical protein